MNTTPLPTLPRSRFSANFGTLFTEYPLPDRVAAAKACGFEVVEFQFPYDHAIDELKAALDRSQVRLNNLNAPRGDISRDEWGLAGVPGREEDFRRCFAQAVDYAQGLGAGVIHVMGGVCAPEDLARDAGLSRGEETYVSNLRWAAGEIAGSGITIVLEPLNAYDRPGNVVCKSDRLVELLGEIGEPSVRLMFDFYHIQVMEGDLIRRFRRHLPHIGHVQIANAPLRTAPDVGEINFAAIFEELAQSDYAGPIGLEYKPKGRTEDDFGWMESFGIR
jgi:2-dehydrotetronate isomerase